MTAKRDLKKHVRERQARTGEAYVTALRHVLAARDGGGDPVPVVEMEDVSAAAQDCGLRFRAVMFPGLRRRVDPKAALTRLRQVLDETGEDPAFEPLRAVLLGGEWRQAELDGADILRARQFLERARAGVGGVSEGGTRVALQIEGRDGPELVLFVLRLWPHMSFTPVSVPPMLMIGGTDELATRVLGWELP